jgi:CysZ protein
MYNLTYSISLRPLYLQHTYYTFILLKELIIAIQSYRQAHRFIVQQKLWKWILLPGLVYALLFSVSMYFFGKSAFHVIDYVNTITGLKKWLQHMQDGWLGFFFAFGGMTVWIILMFTYFSLFKHIWLIVGSPVFSYLSEKMISIIEQKPFTFTTKQWLEDTVRGIQLSIRNGFWQLIYAVALLILALIPIVGWIAPLIALMIEFYFYGFAMLDCSFERKHISIANGNDFISKHKGLAIGNGLVFYLMHVFLVVGWVLAPAYAVIAATLSLQTQKQKS